MSKALKAFMLDHFDYKSFKKCGLYPKDLKFNDYEGQAKIICNRLGLKSIYEYGQGEIRCHITYASGNVGIESARPLSINEKGELQEPPFVETFFPNQLHI